MLGDRSLVGPCTMSVVIEGRGRCRKENFLRVNDDIFEQVSRGASGQVSGRSVASMMGVKHNVGPAKECICMSDA